MYSGAIMQEQNIFCPECGEQLNKGEISRIKNGIDIACHTCGIEIMGDKLSPETYNEPKKETDDFSDNIGEKIKSGILTFVKKTKEWAQEMGFPAEKKPTNEFSNEDSEDNSNE